MGIISEKEGNFMSSAELYQAALKMSLMRNASFGFRLAFNYLKTRKFVRCMKV